MRTILFSVLVLGIAGCSTPEIDRLSAACEEGNLEACAVSQQLKQERAEALSQAFSRSGKAIQNMDPAYRQPAPTHGMISCTRMGVFTNCTY